MDEVSGWVAIALILLAICLYPVSGVPSSTHLETVGFSLPNASSIIVAENFKLSQGVRLGGSAVVPEVVVNFTTFKEHARGTVYVTCNDDLKFYTIVNGTLWTATERFSKVKRCYVNGTTLVAEVEK